MAAGFGDAPASRAWNLGDQLACVQALQRFQRADLPASGSGVQKIGFDPKKFHLASFES